MQAHPHFVLNGGKRACGLDRHADFVIHSRRYADALDCFCHKRGNGFYYQLHSTQYRIGSDNLSYCGYHCDRSRVHPIPTIIAQVLHVPYLL